jgi:hypothetical protein
MPGYRGRILFWWGVSCYWSGDPDLIAMLMLVRRVVGTVLRVKRGGGLVGGQQWLDPLGWLVCYRSWDGVGVIIIIIIWCMGGDGVWYDEEWVLSVDPVGEMKSHAVSWSLMTWRAMSRRVDPMSGCYRIANDKSPASLRGSVKNI